ncbi:MAG: TspO/MBR family protein [Paracoccaceae bacterium]|nr:TspO/MBR family protein [Paracoccaceae bacterium]
MDPLLFIIFLAGCGAAATTGAMFDPGEWYEGLEKPPWTPAKWVFPAAWSVLYLCIAAAGARVAVLEGSAYAMAFFALQLALNTLWTPIFFGLRRMGAGMVVIVFLWLAVAATMLAFFALDWIAGALFAPYLLWVTIAAALNFSVWRRNPTATAA